MGDRRRGQASPWAWPFTGYGREQAAFRVIDFRVRGAFRVLHLPGPVFYGDPEPNARACGSPRRTMMRPTQSSLGSSGGLPLFLFAGAGCLSSSSTKSDGGISSSGAGTSSGSSSNQGGVGGASSRVEATSSSPAGPAAGARARATMPAPDRAEAAEEPRRGPPEGKVPRVAPAAAPPEREAGRGPTPESRVTHNAGARAQESSWSNAEPKGAEPQSAKR
jgi:hypothetical protein